MNATDLPFRPLPFDEFRSRVDRLYSTGRHAPGTRTRMALVLRELAALGVETTAGLTTDAMARYVLSKGPGANRNTVNGYLASIAAACSYAVEEGWLARPPAWRRVRLRSSRMVKNLPPTYEQMGRLLAHLRVCAASGRWVDRRLNALVWTFSLTALRLREATRLQLADVELDGPVPTLAVVPRRRLKTEASAARVAVPDRLAAVLRPWLAEAGPLWVFPGVKRRGPWDGGSPGYKPIDHLRRAASEVGIARITWHSLRHAFGTYAIERWNQPVWVVQRQMRHTDMRTTLGYAHLDDSPAVAASLRAVGYFTAD